MSPSLFFSSLSFRTDQFCCHGDVCLFSVDFAQQIICVSFHTFLVSSSSNDDKVGGACTYCHTQILHMDQCIFETNRAVSGGGAMYFNSLLYGTLENCMFENNSAAYGGAIFAHSQSRNNQQFTLEKCSFNGNAAKVKSGAMLLNGTSINISHSDLSSNKSPVGSAIYFYGEVSILNVTLGSFRNNNGSYDDSKFLGSAVHVGNALHVYVTGVTFHKNYPGGGILLKSTIAEIHSCRFSSNTAVYGGALSTHSNTGKLLIINSSFTDNIASVASTMLLTHRNTLIQTCFFSNNKASDDPVAILVVSKSAVFFRFYSNTFIAPRQKHHPREEVILDFQHQLQAATLYFWETAFQFHSNKSVPIDEHFLHNQSMPKFYATQNGIKITTLISEFASGRLHTRGISLPSGWSAKKRTKRRRNVLKVFVNHANKYTMSTKCVKDVNKTLKHLEKTCAKLCDRSATATCAHWSSESEEVFYPTGEERDSFVTI